MTLILRRIIWDDCKASIGGEDFCVIDERGAAEASTLAVACETFGLCVTPAAPARTIERLHSATACRPDAAL
jgi:hypothetical protein